MGAVSKPVTLKEYHVQAEPKFSDLAKYNTGKLHEKTG